MRKRVIYTAGVFDLLHAGHLQILRRSRELGDALVVGVVSDDGTEAYKGRRPVQPEQERIELVESLPWVTLALVQPTTDPTLILEAIRPAAMTHGDDWAELRQGQATLDRLGIEWVLLPYVPDGGHMSGPSSRIRETIIERGAA